MKSLYLLLLLSCLGCGEAYKWPEFYSHIEEHQTDAGKIWVLNPQGTRRVLLIHGMTTDHIQWCHDEPSGLVDHMWREGWQIIMIDLPATKGNSWQPLYDLLTPTYRGNFQHTVDTVFAYADTNLHPVTETIVGGISWGGLHALMTAAVEPSVSAYFTFIPVVDIIALHGFENYGLSNFAPANEIPYLATKKAFVYWGDADAVVDSNIQTSFVTTLQNYPNTIVEAHKQAGLGHALNDEMFNEAKVWVDAL